VPADLAGRWVEAQREVGQQVEAPSRGLRSVISRVPTIRPGTKGDTLTVGADVATIGAGAATGVKLAGDGLSIPGIGEVTPSVDVLEFSAAAAEILTFVSLGLNIFSLGENLVRGWDAKIRLAAFIKAYQELPENDPLRPYLVEAAKQQRWEKNRRWVRVAVAATIIGLTIAALTVASGGALLLAIAAVPSIGKAIETIRNLWRKYRAKKQQRATAEEMINQGLAAEPDSQTRTTLVDLLAALNIPMPNPQAARKDFDKQKAYAIDQLVPHLSRTDEAIKQALPQQAEAFVQAADAQADAQIAQVQAAAGRARRGRCRAGASERRPPAPRAGGGGAGRGAGSELASVPGAQPLRGVFRDGAPPLLSGRVDLVHASRVLAHRDEQPREALDIADVDRLRGDSALGPHVVVVAQREAGRPALVAEEVVRGRLGGAAVH